MHHENARHEKHHQEKFSTDYLMMLNQHLILSIPANFLCTLIVFIALFHGTNSKNLMIWFIASVTTFFINAGLFLLNWRDVFKPQFYLKCLIATASIYGMLWGFVGLVLMPDNDLFTQLLIISIVIGVTSGAIHVLEPHITACFLFLTFSILPLDFWLFYQQSNTYFLLGGSLLIYFCFLFILANWGHRFLNHHLNLRFQNVNLINQLMVVNKIIEESESLFRSVFASSAMGMAIVSLSGQWLKVNDALCQLIGYSEPELLNTNMKTITYHDDLELGHTDEAQLLSDVIKFYNLEKRFIHKDGNTIWVLLSYSLIRDNAQAPLYFIVQIQNMNTQKQAEEKLHYLAHHDVLTGLANRKQLDDFFELALAYAKRNPQLIALFYIDLDDFKEINDQFGHDIGDLLLIEVAKRLKSSVRETDLVARYGGDEFIVVLTNLSSTTLVTEIASTLLNVLSQPIMLNQHQLTVTASMGISLYPENGRDFNILVKKADEGLYQVKSRGKNNFFLTNRP